MKPIKKFSAILNEEKSLVESITKTYGAGVLDLVKKLGYSSLEEIAKEKKMLTKLESLLKDLPKKADISEDDAEEIEKKDIELGEPKSLEGEEGEEEGEGNPGEEVAEADLDAEELEAGDEGEDEEVGGAGKAVPKEVGDGEATADEIEDDGLAMGEPEEQPGEEGAEKVSKDQDITKEVPDEEDDTEAGREIEKEEESADTPKATRRIKTFEDFLDEKEVTVNKNINYHDDDEEPEDYAVPVAASADPLSEDDEEKGEEDEKKGDELEDKGDKKVDHEDDKEKVDHYKGAVKSDDEQIDALKKDVEYDKEEEEKAKKDESHILSFDNFITEKYDKVVWGGDKGDKSKTHDGEDYEDEDKDESAKNEKFDDVVLGGNKGDKSKTHDGEDYEDEDKKEEKFDDVVLGGNKGDKSKTHDGEDYEDEDKDEAVKEEVGKDEMEAKAETIEDEVKDEEAGAAGEAIPVEKGDGSESAAGIAATTMEEGKPKKQPESEGEEKVTKDQEITKEPETSPDEVGTEEGGKVVTSVPDSDVSESLKRSILRSFGKTEKEINESLKRINEKEIKSADEFKEYAMEVLKNAHGDKFDETKAEEVIKGLSDKYKDDYGAMVGALQSSMG